MRPRLALLQVFLLMIVSGVAVCEAQSVFGLRGPGLTNQVGDARARVLGGSGYALADSLRGSLVNPALGCRLRQVTFGITMVPGMTWAKDASASESWGNLGASAAWLHLPLHPGWTVTTGLRVERSLRGETHWTAEYAGADVGRTFRRDGDHFSLPLAIAFDGPRGRWSGSIGVDFLFASLVEDLSWDFTPTEFPGTTIKTTENLSGAAPTASLVWNAPNDTHVAILYRPRTTLTGNREIKQEAGVVQTGDVSLRYPGRLAAGAAVHAGRVLLAGDVAWETWSDLRRTGEGAGTDGAVDDALSWGIGMELGGDGVMRLPLLGKRPFRAGFRRATEPGIAFGDGSRLTENLASVGTGWILGGGIGVLDLSLEVGARGSLEHQGARERMFQLGVSLTGREPWKKPDRRGRW